MYSPPKVPPVVIGDYLRDQRGWNVHHSDLYKALGLDPLRHLPAEGFTSRWVGNVEIWCLSISDAQLLGKTKRLWCHCPDCSKIISPGHLHQHLRACLYHISKTRQAISDALSEEKSKCPSP